MNRGLRDADQVLADLVIMIELLDSKAGGVITVDAEKQRENL